MPFSDLYFFISDENGPKIQQKLNMLNTEGRSITATTVFRFKLKKVEFDLFIVFQHFLCQVREENFLC